jgi:AcrR family transcriptional regulator
MVTPTVTRRIRERDARREVILKTARGLFLKNGIAGTTMEDIARACELAKGTLYLYFRSKDEVAFAVLVRATDELLTAMRASLKPSLPAVDQLTRLAVEYSRFYAAQPESFRYMFMVPHESYAGRVSAELVEQWGATGREALGIVAGLLRQAVSEGDLSVANPESTAVALWSAITGVIAIPSQEVRRPFLGDVNVEQLVIETVQSILRGLAQGRATERSAT